MLPEDPDVLSQVLKLIRLRGDLVFHGELGRAAQVAFPPGPATFLHLRTGELWVSQRDGEGVMMRPGDFVLLPHADGATVRGEPDADAPQCFDADVQAPSQVAQTFRWATDDGIAATFLAGAFYFDGAPLRSLLTGLPGMIHLTCDRACDPPWLASISHFLDVESRADSPGSSLMISRLIDVLVIRAMRTWVRTAPPEKRGWLGALADVRISRALKAIHDEPFRRRTVAELAGIAGMSRSSFAERFATLIGAAPLHYQTRWRLLLANEMLKGPETRVSDVGRRVGYDSDAAFSRAFKAQFGYPPAQAMRGGLGALP
jgi:AraC-like DNA-binding protein